MTPRTFGHAILLGILTWLPREALAAPPEELGAIAARLAELENLWWQRSSEPAPREQEFRSLWAHIGRSLSHLQEIARSPGVAASAEYRQNLQLTADALAALAAGQPNDRALRVCSAVARDLKVKARHADRALAKADGAGNALRNFSIAVRTVRNSEEVAECEVWYVPAGWSDVPNSEKRFPALSSPAKAQLPPGYYVLWATRNGIAGERRTFEIGETKDLQLAAP